MGTTPVPPLASQDLTTTKLDVDGVPPFEVCVVQPPPREVWGGAVTTNTHTNNTDTTGKERTKDRRVTTTRGGSGGERFPLTFTPTLTLPVKNGRKTEG